MPPHARRPALLLALCFFLTPLARGEERVVRDEWRSVLCQGVKEAWEHERIVERPGVGFVVADRTVQLHVVRAKLREDHGMAPTVRAALCAFAREDGTTVQVVICAFDLDWDLAGLDRVLASLRWLETR